MSARTPIPDTSSVPAQAPPEERMRALIEVLSGYIETYHGGSVELLSYEGEVLRVQFKGACVGCPLSPATLHGWVEGTVRQFFPSLKRVEAA